MELLIKIASVLVWAITLIMPVLGWLTIRFIKSYDGKFDEIDRRIAAIWGRIEENQNNNQANDEDFKLLLQQVIINLRNICNKLNIDYLDNGTKIYKIK